MTNNTPTTHIKFTLQGHGMVFEEDFQYLAAGFIPSIHGISLCGRYHTTARMADIDILSKMEDAA